MILDKDTFSVVMNFTNGNEKYNKVVEQIKNDIQYHIITVLGAKMSMLIYKNMTKSVNVIFNNEVVVSGFKTNTNDKMTKINYNCTKTEVDSGQFIQMLSNNGTNITDMIKTLSDNVDNIDNMTEEEVINQINKIKIFKLNYEEKFAIMYDTISVELK